MILERLVRVIAVTVLFCAVASGCRTDSNTGASGSTTTALSETNLAASPGLTMKPGQTVVMYIEPLDAQGTDHADTGTMGTDVVPVLIEQEGSYTYALQEGDIVHTLVKAVMLRLPGRETVFELNAGTPSITVTLTPGEYEMVLYSNFIMSSAAGMDHRVVFLRPDEQAGGSQLLSRSCSNCDLRNADLSGANLGGVNLSGADLSDADLTDAYIANANMIRANLLGVTAPTGLQGRSINLVSNCSITIWAAATGNTAAVKCRSSDDCNGGVCPPLPDKKCEDDPNCKNLCTKYPCGSNAECPETNTYCGGLPSYNKPSGCTKSTDCGAHQLCNATTGQCGWKNCQYVPIPVEKEQIISATQCTTNKGCCPDGKDSCKDQFCYTTTSATGVCAKLPSDSKGNSWQMAPNTANPLFVPTPWAGRFWPRTECSLMGTACTAAYAGNNAGCEVSGGVGRTIDKSKSQQYNVRCRTNDDCGHGPNYPGDAIESGQCVRSNATGTIEPNFESAPPKTSQCSTDADCSNNGVCWNRNGEIPNSKWLGQCGYFLCTTYKCSGDGDKICNPKKFECLTGTCYNENDPADLTENCRQSGKNSPTLAELNMFFPSKGIDFYDISLVDGANVPVQIAPSAKSYDMTVNEEDASKNNNDYSRPNLICSKDSECWNSVAKLDANWICDKSRDPNHTTGYCVNKYYCGSPGCVSDCPSYGSALTAASTWGGRNAAIAEADCPAGLRLKTSDGKTYLGCLSPTDACKDHKSDTWQKSLPACDDDHMDLDKCMVNCEQRHMDLYQGIGTNAQSCYSDNADKNTCCGCPDWMPLEFCDPAKNSNATWRKIALPFYKPFHKASPNSYTYPYDDKSGTFTCRGVNDATNVNYTVTFCPQK